MRWLKNDFNHLSQEFKSELLELVKRKVVYPYEHMNSFKKKFYNKLPHCFSF